MKRLIALLMACTLMLLCGCGGVQEGELYEADFPGNLKIFDRPTPAPTPAPTPTPTPKPVYENPLNGELLDAPYTGRVFAASISNVEKATPHVGVAEADIFMEMYVNGSVVRGLALYSDIASVEAFGGVRSTRPMFHELVRRYDAILLYSGGADKILNELFYSKLDAYNIDIWALRQFGVSFRDRDHGRPYENSLMGVGSKLVEYAQQDGKRLTSDHDYGLTFADNAVPADGAIANELGIEFSSTRGGSKLTSMKYDNNLGKYVYWQYGREMRDQNTDAQEAFTNVIVMNTVINSNDGYHRPDFNQGGDGMFACGGKLIPITWSCADNTSAFEFFTADGQPLSLQRGNTYIAIAANGSTITWA